MVTTYIPKTSLLSPTRIQRIAKKLIDEAGEDRQLALQAHRFFREMIDENPQDAAAKALMVDTLKVAQASKNNVVKILNLMIKMEETSGAGEDMTKYSTKTKGKTMFSELDTLTNG
jgi:type I site-specific restriction-modification system R (restriction) subunit